MYKCIECSAELKTDKFKALCPKCGKVWESADGIFDFSTKNFYWNQISTEAMSLIIEDALKKGWKKTITEFFGKERKYLQEYIISSGRADWMLFAPIDSSSRISRYRFRMGRSINRIAKKYSEVYATDCNLDTLKFLKIRADQEGLENHKVIKNKSFGLPSFSISQRIF